MNNIIQEVITKRKVMDIFLKYHDREFTINELTKLSGIPYSSNWRFIQKLNRAGVIEVKTIGHSSVCKLNKSSPFLKEIKKVLETKPTPQKTVIDSFVTRIKNLKQIKRMVLFGSVARDQEKLTSDIDIAIIVQKRNKKIEEKITEVVDNILERSRMVIIPIIMTEKELKENKQFEKEVNKGKVLYERDK